MLMITFNSVIKPLVFKKINAKLKWDDYKSKSRENEYK